MAMTGEMHSGKSVLLKTKKVRKRSKGRPAGSKFVAASSVRKKPQGIDGSDKGDY